MISSRIKRNVSFLSRLLHTHRHVQPSTVIGEERPGRFVDGRRVRERQRVGVAIGDFVPLARGFDRRHDEVDEGALWRQPFGREAVSELVVQHREGHEVTPDLFGGNQAGVGAAADCQ